jgi:hypothetical protein
MQKCGILLFAIITVVTPASAQSGDDLNARRAAVREFYASRDEDKIIEALAQTVTDSYVGQLQKARPEITAAQLDTMRSEIRANLIASKETYLSDEETLLAEKLSLDDLHAVIAFYETSAGKKLADIAIEMIPEVGKIQLAWTSAAIKKATDDVNAAAKARK